MRGVTRQGDSGSRRGSVGAWESHRLPARVFFDCRRKGLTVHGSLDCLVAQIALDHEAALLHDDDDFERIARVRPLRLLRG